MDTNPFEDIAPYNDEEAAAALARVANHPNVPWISKFIFSNQPETYLRDILKSIHSVDEFQKAVMSYAIEWVIKTSVNQFTYDGLDKLKAIQGRYLAMSNHRDIILDPAFTQIILHWNQMPMTEICVGDNLLKSRTIEYLIRSNRMIKVIRGISARELYLSSQILSKYIRETITSGKGSVWIAQRAGRTKDGIDVTEQGLLKMFDMSGTGDFVQNFRELNIVPISISYEYEPCDILKAREVLISRTQKYVKTENEDLHSIMIGIKQKKGNVHLNFGTPLNDDEICAASLCDKNDRYQPGFGQTDYRRLPALEHQLHRLRPVQQVLQVRREIYAGRSRCVQGLYGVSTGPGGTHAGPRRTPRHLPQDLWQSGSDEGEGGDQSCLMWTSICGNGKEIPSSGSRV